MTALRQLLTVTAALAALSVGPALAADSVTINYHALDSLPPKSAAKGVAVPKLIPPSLVRKHMAAVAAPDTYNAPAVADNDSVPPVFDRNDTLYNGVEGMNAGELGPVSPAASHPPAVGPAPTPTATATASIAPAHAQASTKDAVPPRTEQQLAMLMPMPATSVPAASARAARFTDTPLPPLASWEHAKNVGEVLFPSARGAELIDLAPSALAELDAVAQHINNANQRVMLEAFGGGRGDTSHEAHRIALRRGLAVRRYLIARGVPSNRIDILAVGGAKAGPLNRVDVMAAAI